jgi:hypothetical protein
MLKKHKRNLIMALPLAIILAGMLFAFLYITGAGDILKSRESNAAPVLQTSNYRVNCQARQRCTVRWEQRKGWGWVQASGPGVKSRVFRRTCTGPSYGWCQFSQTFQRPADPGKRWVNVELSTEGRHNWKGKRCFY